MKAILCLHLPVLATMCSTLFGCFFFIYTVVIPHGGCGAPSYLSQGCEFLNVIKEQ